MVGSKREGCELACLVSSEVAMAVLLIVDGCRFMKAGGSKGELKFFSIPEGCRDALVGGEWGLKSNVPDAPASLYCVG